MNRTAIGAVSAPTRASFVRDFAILSISLILPGLVSVVGRSLTGHGATTPLGLLSNVGTLIFDAVWIGAFASTAFRYLGQPALWKEIAACALVSLPLYMLMGYPQDIRVRLLAALFIGMFLAGMRRKVLAWLARRKRQQRQRLT